MTAVADPLGGSWYVERLTRELEEKAWALIEEVEAHGGMTKAVAEGLPKHRIEEAAAARAAKVDTGETVIVGVNRYRLAEEEEHDFLEVDNAKVRAGQIARIEKVRAGRDGAKVAGGAGCAGSGRARRGKPARARRRGARARCTLGEISDALERAFGRYGTVPEPVRGIYGKARRDGRWKAGRRRHAIRRRTARPQATNHGRQDGPGRARPRRQFGLIGVHRSGLRSDPRAAVPDPARDRANGGRTMTSTWSAQARSPRAIARSSRR